MSWTSSRRYRSLGALRGPAQIFFDPGNVRRLAVIDPRTGTLAWARSLISRVRSVEVLDNLSEIEDGVTPSESEEQGDNQL